MGSRTSLSHLSALADVPIMSRARLDTIVGFMRGHPDPE